MGLYDSRDGTSDDGSTAQVSHAALYNPLFMCSKNRTRGGWQCMHVAATHSPAGHKPSDNEDMGDSAEAAAVT